MDIVQLITLNISTFAIVFISLALAMVIVVLYFIFNAKFPVIHFLVFDRGKIYFEKRRKKGNMAVNPSLIYVVTNARCFGENMEQFIQVEFNNKRYYLARKTDAGILIPVELSVSILKDQSDDVKEILKWKVADRWALTGKKIAMEYVNSIDETEKTIEKSNPLVIGLLANAPLILTITIIATTLIICMSFIGETFKPMVDTMHEISKQLVIAGELFNSTVTTNSPVSAVSDTSHIVVG